MVTSDADTAAERAARRHPLAFLAGHYTVQAGAFLASLERSRLEPSPRGSALDVVSWYHTLIPLQTHRALAIAYQAKLNAPELLADSLASREPGPPGHRSVPVGVADTRGWQSGTAG